MAVQFKPAERRKRKLRMCIDGISGSGKSITSLLVMRGVVGPEGRIAVIDTEHESCLEYAGICATEAQPTGFDHVALTDFAVEKYIEAIKAAVAGGYDGLVIDQASHAWAGKGGLLEFVDANAGAEGAYFSKEGWRKATPKQHRFIDAMIGAPLHLIVTLRDKSEYVIEETANGKKQPRKVGLAPVQRDGFEYEFSILGTMDAEHTLRITKSRTLDAKDGALSNFLEGAVIQKPGLALGQQLRAWLEAPPGEWQAPAFARTFKVNGEDVTTKGITEATYIAAAKLGAELNKVKGGGAARALLSAEPFRVASMRDLDEAQGQVLVAALTAALKEGAAA